MYGAREAVSITSKLMSIRCIYHRINIKYYLVLDTKHRIDIKGWGRREKIDLWGHGNFTTQLIEPSRLNGT